MKGSLTAVFSAKDIDRRLSNFISDKQKKIINALIYAGEKFINAARNISTYLDRTGNLRSSIGYVIGLNGEQIKKNMSGSSEGIKYAEEIASEILQKCNKGFVLIGFAGMKYAAAVESKGYDVITNSIPGATALLNDFKRILKAA